MCLVITINDKLVNVVSNDGDKSFVPSSNEHHEDSFSGGVLDNSAATSLKHERLRQFQHVTNQSMTVILNYVVVREANKLKEVFELSSSPPSTVKRPPITGNQSPVHQEQTHQINCFQSESKALLTQSKPMVTPTSLTFKSLECFESLYTPSSLERAENVESLYGCKELFEEVMSTVESPENPSFEYLGDEKSTETNANNISITITIAHEIYKNLRDYEARKRPSTHYMETVQGDINAEVRAILIDWLVGVTEERRLLLLPEVLFLTVNCIDRYLSGISINRRTLPLLGLACMMIACKYESPESTHRVAVLCSVIDNTYSKDEVRFPFPVLYLHRKSATLVDIYSLLRLMQMIQMEYAVLKHLNFEIAVPTAYIFLRQFVWVAETTDKDYPLQFEHLGSYIVQLSLLEYAMLRYAPALIAASAVFLARFILCPLDKPWDPNLREYTLYQASDLVECVMALHRLYREEGCANLDSMAVKYSQPKYYFVATRACHATIPDEFFQDVVGIMTTSYYQLHTAQYQQSSVSFSNRFTLSQSSQAITNFIAFPSDTTNACIPRSLEHVSNRIA
ncbi:hypothetical protein GQ457_09G011210 [Hibiscus cannabinus]